MSAEPLVCVMPAPLLKLRLAAAPEVPTVTVPRLMPASAVRPMASLELPTNCNALLSRKVTTPALATLTSPTQSFKAVLPLALASTMPALPAASEVLP